MEIEVKDLSVLKSLFDKLWHPKLVMVYVWILTRFARALITEGYREPLHFNDLHGIDKLLRALDLRSWIYDNPDKIAENINKHWIYDPDRPSMKVCVYHDVGQGKHFHIQVHNRTEMRV